MIKDFSDVFFLDQKSVSDERGSFTKFFDSSLMLGHSFVIKQQNFVVTEMKDTFRGLHYQKEPHAEAKIFRVLNGRIKLVIFDTRPNSPTYKKSAMVQLADPNSAIFVPKGYATGYLTVEDNTQVLYMSDENYHPESERGISIFDNVISVQLSIEKSTLSEKDAQWPDWNE